MEDDCLPRVDSKQSSKQRKSSRSQTSSFLYNTVLRLGEDSHRSENWPLGDIANTATPLSARPVSSPTDLNPARGLNSNNRTSTPLKQAGTPTFTASTRSPQLSPSPDDLNCGKTVDMWRAAFHAEAMDCVRSMQAVVDSANLKHFASRFDDWRKIDMKATAEMQQHVKELTKLNASTEQFLLKCTNVENLMDFQERLMTLTQRADELAVTREEISSNVDAIAGRAAAKVVAGLKAEVRTISTTLRSHVDETVEWRCSNSDECLKVDTGLKQVRICVDELGEGVKRQCQQIGSFEVAQKQATEQVISLMEEIIKRMHGDLWDKFDARLNHLQEQVESFGGEIRRQCDHVKKLETTQQQNSERVILAFDNAVKDIHNSVKMSAEQLTSSLRENAATDLAAFEQHVTNAFSDSRSYLIALDGRVAEWERTAKAEAKHWRDMSDRLREQISDTEDALGKARKKQTVAEQHQSESLSQVHNLESELGRTQSALEAARCESFSTALRRLVEFENRGNLQINRQCGEVKIVKGIDFVQCKPSDTPTAKLLNPEAAEVVLVDLLELAKIFTGSIAVEVHTKEKKGGTAAFWDTVADLWAGHLVSLLESRGVSPSRLTAKGCAGRKGLNLNCVLLKLDPDYFVEEPKSPRAKSSPRTRGR